MEMASNQRQEETHARGTTRKSKDEWINGGTLILYAFMMKLESKSLHIKSKQVTGSSIPSRISNWFMFVFEDFDVLID